MNFSHLHVHNEFSFLDGFGSAESYVKEAKKLGFNYLSLTNHGNIDGLIKFQKACEKEKIDPILGCEAYIVPDMLRKEKGEKRGHITLLVKNEIGWKNLCQMLTKANLDGFYYRPRIDYESLMDHCEGLIVLTGCSASFLHLPGGIQLFDHLQAIIGKDLYLEVMPHLMEDQIKTNNLCIELSQQYSVPIVATNDCHYIKATDSEAQEVLLAMQTKAKWTDIDRYRFSINGLYLRTANEMRNAFKEQGVFDKDEIEGILDWTEDIYEKCKFKIPKQNISLPKVPGYENEDPGEFIWNLAEKQLLAISQNWETEKVNLYFDRLSEEWKLIQEKGFSPYFLIVWELISWCKKSKIMTGPGRGSVGGSLLAFLLGITSVDPIKYGLLFSRFIAEDRQDLPDIDMDFEDRKRHLVREHLESLYGKNHIASLSTFMTMKGRGTVRDICRVFDVPLSEADVFAKSIIESPDSDEKVIEEALKTDIGKEFKEKHGDLVEYMSALEGQIKSVGQHAAALIISSEDLREGTRGNLAIRSNEIVCNWDMKDSEQVGLMKLDVLGLNTLSILNETRQQIISKDNPKLFLYHPESDCYFVGDEVDQADCDSVEFEFEKIPLNDKRIYQSLYEGNTVGVFQLSAWATTALAKQIHATNINELSDIIALVRPGPADSGQTTTYIARKNGGNGWEKKHPTYEEIVKNTYGIIIYQEQVMEVIHKVAGLPYVTADKIRKVISKKRDAKEFKQYEEAFVAGCLEKKTFSAKEARTFWKELQAHARYSFNLSHSTAYAILGYYTAWCKMYYPVEFMCAALTYGSENKKEELVKEAYRMGLEIVTPKVGVSDAVKWTSKDGKLYVPFIEIKGFGEKMALKCNDIKSSKVVVSRAPIKKTRGFFFSNTTEVKIIEKTNGGKLESILTEIGAFGGNPTGDFSKYFSFKIETPAKNNTLEIIVGDLANNPRVLSLDIEKGTIKNAIKEISFAPKKSLSRCPDCELRGECRGPVHASPGHFNVSIISDTPGSEEDEKKKCLMGPAGKVVWDELLKYELKRDDFHLSSVCKCFPSISKSPKPNQIKICSEKWLFEELKEIDCRLILAFGNISLQAFTGRAGGIKEMSGKTEWNEKAGAWICWCLHPSAVLRDINNKGLFETGIKNFIDKIEILS